MGMARVLNIMLIGLILGAVAGATQFVLFARLSKILSSGDFDRKVLFLGIGQFLLPLVVLVGCALVISDSLVWAAIGLATSLCILAVTRFANSRK